MVNRWAVEILRNKIKTIPYDERHTVLDVACGVSVLGKCFGKHVYGIDMNREAVTAAKKNGIQAKRGDVEEPWDYPDGFFDVVIASHIIEHMTSPDHLLREAKRVLKDGGTILLITPNLAAWFNRILLLFGFQPFFTEVSTVDKTLGLTPFRSLHGGTTPLGHLRLFTPGALKDLVELHGFGIVQTGAMEFGSFPPPLSYIDKLFSNVPSLAACLFVVAKKS